MRDFRKIKAWMLADDLAVAIYEVSKGFPREEAYGLTSQIRRAASSVPANIVGGASRESAKDYAHFCRLGAGRSPRRNISCISPDGSVTSVASGLKTSKLWPERLSPACTD